MEKRKILVTVLMEENEMENKHIPVTKQGNILRIGKSPQLIVNLDTQENYIETSGQVIPYHKQVHFSPDLIRGERAEVFQAAVKYYYGQASTVAEGMKYAEVYRGKANTTVREVKR
jgi:hypothetical protein